METYIKLSRISGLLAGILCLGASCTNPLDASLDKEPTMLMMNGMLDQAENLHVIYLGCSASDRIAKAPDADVKCYINGSLAAEAAPALSSELDIPRYPLAGFGGTNHPESLLMTCYAFNAAFTPGDQVRITAQTKDGKYSAEANLKVPEPASIIEADTVAIAAIPSGESGPGKMGKLKFSLKIEDRPGTADFYRFAIASRVKVTMHKEGKEDRIEYGRYIIELDTSEDPIVSEGKPVNPDKASGDFEITDFFSSRNPYSVFSDRMFADRTATITGIQEREKLLVSETSDMDWDSLEIETHLDARLYSCTEKQYYYLKAISTLESGMYIPFFSEPVTIPSNVTGGIGMVGISTPSTVTFKMPLLEVDDTMFYYGH